MKSDLPHRCTRISPSQETHNDFLNAFGENIKSANGCEKLLFIYSKNSLENLLYSPYIQHAWKDVCAPGNNILL